MRESPDEVVTVVAPSRRAVSLARELVSIDPRHLILVQLPVGPALHCHLLLALVMHVELAGYGGPEKKKKKK